MTCDKHYNNSIKILLKSWLVIWGLISLSSSVLLANTTKSQSGSDSVNVLLIFVDDLGAMDIGAYGSDFYETPNIDNLAKSSVMFTTAYSSSPVCSPSRAALQTGKAPERLKITDWIPGYTARAKNRKGKALETPEILQQLPLKEITLAETFKANGYDTFYAGKWHLGSEGFHPQQQGYDINIGGYHKGSPPSYYSPYKNPQLADGPDGEYLPDRLTDETLSFIKQRDSDKPFFAMLSYYTVHTPIVAAKPYLAHYQNKKLSIEDKMPLFGQEKFGAHTRQQQSDPAYASMVHALDMNIGKLINGLKEAGLDDNTLVIFTSDNGGLSIQGKKAPTSTLPFRAGKGWLYEGGLRIPMLINLPAKLKPSEIDEPVMLTDLAPTIYSLTGVNVAKESTFDGIDLSDLMINQKSLARDAVKVYFPHYHASRWRPGFMIREGDWKLIYFYEEDSMELYDLSTDLSESNNLINEHPALAQKLKKKMNAWLDKVGASRPKQKLDNSQIET